MAGSSPLAELPRFEDRVPDLVLLIRKTSEELAALQPHNSYLPAWEDLYAGLHSLKGIVNILITPPGLADFIARFTLVVNEALVGSMVVRRGQETASVLQQLASLLEQGGSPAELNRVLDALPPLMDPDIPHESRRNDIPQDLYYVSELVSKKAREIILLQWNHCIVEDLILLEQVPFWKTQLLESLQIENRGRGLLVNFLPFIGPEGSQELKIWAWVGAPTDSRASLKQRIKAVMPRVQITSLKLHSEKL